MKKFVVVLLVLSIICVYTPALMEEKEMDSLCELAAPYGFKIGAPLSYDQIHRAVYLNKIKAHFNSITTTNEMKAYSLLDLRATQKRADGMPAMNYSQADEMVKWARDNGIGVRGHVLVWDAYMTDWFFRQDYDASKPYADRETMMARTEFYINEVITHFETEFPGVVYCWDVVNEAVADGPNEYAAGDPRHLRTLRSGQVNLFREYLGDDYVSWAFLWARNTVEALNADIKLYYNDYNAYFPDKAKAILALVKEVNSFAKDEQGNDRMLCDGIGMQGYIGGYGVQAGCLEDSHLGMIRNAILGYAAEGFEVQITEMAVRNFDPAYTEKHMEFYTELFRIFKKLNTENGFPLKAVSIWGLTDTTAPAGTYVYNLNSPYGGLLDVKFQYKDVFWAVCNAMKE